MSYKKVIGIPGFVCSEIWAIMTLELAGPPQLVDCVKSANYEFAYVDRDILTENVRDLW